MSFEYHIMVNAFRKRLKNAGFVFTQFHDVIDEWNGYYRYDRGVKEWGLDDLCPDMTPRDMHSDMYLIPGDDFFETVAPGETYTMPITASFITGDVPEKMMVKTAVHGWNRFGEHKEYYTSEFSMQPEPYQVFDLKPVTFQTPKEEALAVFCTYLKDERGRTHNRNFIPFRVVAEDRRDEREPEQIIVRLAPDDFSDSDWSIRQMSVLDGLKVSGTGTGYFEYEFSVLEDIAIEDIQDVEFLAELSARHVQSKYSRRRYIQGDSEGDRQENEEDDDGGWDEFGDQSYRYNSYAMTDPIKHTSRVTITLNGADPQTFTLDDDPADHRGLLSWLNQVRPKSLARRDFREKEWKLEDAGSYGYRVSRTFDREAIERALDEKVFRIKLAVNESSDTSGGLAVYGEQFGRYPLGPTVIIRTKQTVEVAESNRFPKHVEVFGVHVYATADSSDEIVLHVANVLAEYLDNDEDGVPDNQKVMDALIRGKAVYRHSDDDEVHPNGAAEGLFDASLEEVLHLITDEGYGVAYPEVFGRVPGTEISNALDKARGGRFMEVPEHYPEDAWFTYDDTTCDYDCQNSEYIYWVLTSILGAQDYPGRLEQIQREWRLNTREKVKEGDPDAYALFTDPKYKFPTVLPDGKYKAKTFTIQKYP